MELTFEVVSGVGVGIRVLDGGPGAPKEGRFRAFIAPIRLNGVAYFSRTNVFDSCVKSRLYFHTDTISLESSLRFIGFLKVE